MDVTFLVATSLFILFIALILVSSINYFTRIPESATILELRGKTKNFFDVFFGSGGIVTGERATINLYRIPMVLEEKNGTARTNEIIAVSADFDDLCANLVSWNNTIRVYDQNFVEFPSRISYQEFCSSQWLNTSYVTFIANMTANEKKRVYIYSINNSDTVAPNHTLTIKGYWKFNEDSGTLAKDSSGYQNNGTLKNGTDTCAGGDCPQWVTGLYGGGVKFDGSNDYIIMSDSDSTNVTNTFTLATWIRKNQTGIDQTIIDHRDASDNGYGMRFTSDDNFRCFVNSGGAGLRVTLSTTIGTGGWTHVACNFNNQNMSIYINGSYITSATLTSSASKGSGTTRIGVSSSDTQYMNGTIDEVRIYNQSLTASEMSVLGMMTNQILDVQSFPIETITAISASKVQGLTGRNYHEVKAILGGDFDFRIEIREK